MYNMYTFPEQDSDSYYYTIVYRNSIDNLVYNMNTTGDKLEGMKELLVKKGNYIIRIYQRLTGEE